MFINNAEEQNKTVLTNLVKIAKRTMDKVINTNGADDILAKPKTTAELQEFNANVESIILNRLRSKFNV